MQQLHDHIQSTATTVLLSNLYAQAEERDEVVQLTAGVSNEDDVTLLLRLQQAQALEQQGVPDAALEAYRDALKSKSRNRELLKRARYQRAKLHLDKGRRAMAKRDIGRLYADDPNYRDVAELLRTRA
jgi:tetratricopeptide (TPR) repeat protein